MKTGNRILKAAASSSYLNEEPLPRMPLVEICGQQRVLIESHQGILGYECGEILVKVRFGRICITGDGLKIAKMSKEKLVVTGWITGIALQGGRCNGNI